MAPSSKNEYLRRIDVGKAKLANTLTAIGSLPIAITDAHIEGRASTMSIARIRALSVDAVDHRKKTHEYQRELIHFQSIYTDLPNATETELALENQLKLVAPILAERDRR